ncbi:MAG: hypothetical protein AAF065_14645 [Verrucomicrobiota bacterium]
MKKTIQTIYFIILLSLIAGCALNEEERESIGSVEMKEDGTLAFMLRAESQEGAIGQSYFEVEKEEENYEEYLSHVAPIEVGESKAVKPWKN